MLLYRGSCTHFRFRRLTFKCNPFMRHYAIHYIAHFVHLKMHVIISVPTLEVVMTSKELSYKYMFR